MIKKFIPALLCLIVGAVAALAQSNPGFYQGFVPTAAQWNSYFAAKQDYNPTAGGTIIGGGLGGGSTINGGTTQFYAYGNSTSPTSQGGWLTIPMAGTISNLYVTTSNAPGNSQTYIATLYVGTSPTSTTTTTLTCTIAGASVTSCVDTGDSAAVLAGNIVALKLVASGGAAAFNVTWGAMIR